MTKNYIIVFIPFGTPHLTFQLQRKTQTAGGQLFLLSCAFLRYSKFLLLQFNPEIIANRLLLPYHLYPLSPLNDSDNR